MRRSTLYSIVFLTLCHFTAFSQQYLFDHFTSREGLSNDVINNIYQDDHGFLYISTNAGLSFYDGSVFRNMTLPVPEGQQLIRKCRPMKDGRIWVNYAGNKELAWVDHSSSGSIQLKTRLIVNNLVEDLGNFPLICSDQGLFAWKKDTLEKLATGLSGNDKLIYDIFPLTDSIVMIARKGLPAALVDRRSFKRLDETPMNISVSDYARDADGNNWLASEDHGLLLLDNEQLKKSKFVFKPLPAALAFLSKEDIFCLSNDEFGNILIGTNHFGLVAWSPRNGVQFFNVSNGLSSNTIKSILVDRDNNWWIGTNNGIDRLNNKSFQLYNKKFGLAPGIMFFTDKDRKQRTWFFGAEKMSYLDKQETGGIEYPASIEKIVLQTLVCEKGLWVSAPFCLFFIESEGKPRVSKLIKTEDTYRRLLELSKDKILLGGKNSIAMMEKGKIRIITDTIPDVRALLKDRYNRIWVGTFEKGIYRLGYDSIKNSFYPLQHIFYATKNIARITTLFEDPSGNVWAGTRFDGVIIFVVDSLRARQKSALTTLNGLGNDYVTSISSSSAHFVWVGGHTGFDRINIHTEPFLVENTSRFYSFSNQVTRLLPDGTGLWGTSDIGAFYVSLYPQKKSASPVYLKTISFPDTTYALYTSDTSISLRSYQHSFSVSFTTPFYTNEKQTSYYYRLKKDSNSEPWIEISGDHSINFNTLQPGNYLLEIKAVMFNGQQASKTATLSIHLATPFIRSIWFILIISLLVIFLAYLLYRYRIGQLKRMFSIRDTISRNLHDEIGATLSSINIYSDVARKKGSDAATGQLLERIYKSSGQAMASINDIVWLVNPANDSLENVVLRMREFCIPLLEAKNISIGFEADETIMSEKLTMHQRQHIYYIFKEAVNNALKYAGASKVMISFRRQGKTLLLSIADDGKGFDLDQHRVGNGIGNMLQRAKAIDGKLTINSSPGKGCSIRLEANIT